MLTNNYSANMTGFNGPTNYASGASVEPRSTTWGGMAQQSPGAGVFSGASSPWSQGGSPNFRGLNSWQFNPMSAQQLMRNHWGNNAPEQPAPAPQQPQQQSTSINPVGPTNISTNWMRPSTSNPFMNPTSIMSMFGGPGFNPSLGASGQVNPITGLYAPSFGL